MIIDMDKKINKAEHTPPSGGYIIKNHPEAAITITHCYLSAVNLEGRNVFEVGPHENATMQTKVNGCVVFNVPVVFNDEVTFNAGCEMNKGEDDVSFVRRTIGKNFTSTLQINSTLIGELLHIREMLENHSRAELRQVVDEALEKCRLK